MSSYIICEIDSCGRKFTDKDKLMEHVRRRHPNILPNTFIEKRDKGELKLPKIPQATNIQKQTQDPSTNNNINIEPIHGIQYTHKSNSNSIQYNIIKKQSLQYQDDDNNNNINNNNQINNNNKLQGGGMATIKSQGQIPIRQPRGNSADKQNKDQIQTSLNNSNNFKQNENQIQQQQQLLSINNHTNNNTINNMNSQTNTNIQQKIKIPISRPKSGKGVTQKIILQNQELQQSQNMSESSRNSKDNQQQEQQEELNSPKKLRQENTNEKDKEPKQQQTPEKNNINSITIITEQLVQQISGFEQIEQVEQLILREQSFEKFSCSFDLGKFKNLICLSLSHNKLITLDSICKLITLEELNVNFNQLTSIKDISQLINLTKLHATNNKIKSIKGLEDCKNLMELQLFKNHLENIKETGEILSQLIFLEELDIDQNPLCRTYNYKYDILSYTQIHRLNGENVTPQDFKVSKALCGESQLENQSILLDESTNASSTQQESGQQQQQLYKSAANFFGQWARPTTAPQKNNSSIFNNNNRRNQRSGKQSYKETLIISEQSERVYELEQELENIQKEREDLQYNYDSAVEEMHELVNQVEKQQIEQERIKQDQDKYQRALVENELLKTRVKTFEDTFLKSRNIKDFELKNEIFRLKTDLEKFQQENIDLKLEKNSMFQENQNLKKDLDEERERQDYGIQSQNINGKSQKGEQQFSRKENDYINRDNEDEEEEEENLQELEVHEEGMNIGIQLYQEQQFNDQEFDMDYEIAALWKKTKGDLKEIKKTIKEINSEQKK